MNVHEYQAKHILMGYQIPCQDVGIAGKRV